MMKTPVMPLETLIVVEPCLCAWYQWVPGAWPISSWRADTGAMCIAPMLGGIIGAAGGQVASLYSGSR